MSDYELYHDESQEGGFWHGMLLVPVEKKWLIADLLEQVRQNTQHDDPLGIKNVNRHKRVFSAAYAWVQVGVGFLRSRSKLEPYPVFLGKRQRDQYVYDWLSDYCLGAKFILFRECRAHQELVGYPDHGSKVETTFRMGFKGGLHFLGSSDDSICITAMHFDGHQHLGRHVDKRRIVNRLRNLRDYCSVSDRDDLIDDGSSDHRREDSQLYEDCQLLQLTDLLVGSFRTALGVQTRDIHVNLSMPVRRLVQRY